MGAIFYPRGVRASPKLPLFATPKFTQCQKKLVFRPFANPATGAHGGQPAAPAGSKRANTECPGVKNKFKNLLQNKLMPSKFSILHFPAQNQVFPKRIFL
jgi:hypothetical protein